MIIPVNCKFKRKMTTTDLKGSDSEDKMAAKKRRPIPTNVFDPYHVYMWAGDKLSTVQKYGAAVKMYRQAEENAGDNKDMLPVYDRRSRAYRHMGKVRAAEKDAVEGLDLDQEYSPLLQARGEVLLDRNLFEDALGTFQRGHAIKPKPPRFQHGIDAAAGVVLGTLGPRAGNLMSNNRLGKVVRKIKLKTLNIAYPEPPDIEIVKRRKLRKMKKIEDAYTDTYLGKASKHYKLLCELNDSGKIFMGNQKENKKLKRILGRTIEKLKEKEGSLWRRNPLYTRELDVIPKATKLFLQQKSEQKKKQVEDHILSELSAIRSLLERKQYVNCYWRGDTLRHYLFEQSETLVPFKREAIDVTIRLLGEMFLSMKRIFLNWDCKKNDERVQYVLGMDKPYKMSHDIYRDGGFHPAIRELDAFIAGKEADLRHSIEPLERCYLYHEAAAAYSMKGRPLIAGTLSRKGIEEAQRAEDPTWQLNCLFMLARTQLQSRAIRDGQVTLAGLKNLAKELKAVDAYHFAERGMALSSHERPGRLAKQDFETEKIEGIVDIMANEELKISARQVIQKILSRPPHKRFSLAKGPKPSEGTGGGDSTRRDTAGQPTQTDEQLYVGGVLVDKRDPDDLERIEEQVHGMHIFSFKGQQV